MNQSTRILRLDASANPDESGSRKLGDHLLRQIVLTNQHIEVL